MHINTYPDDDYPGDDIARGGIRKYSDFFIEDNFTMIPFAHYGKKVSTQTHLLRFLTTINNG